VRVNGDDMRSMEETTNDEMHLLRGLGNRRRCRRLKKHGQKPDGKGQKHRNNNQTELLKERSKGVREIMAVRDWCKRKGKKRQRKTMRAMNVPCRQAKPAAKPAPAARLQTKRRNNNQPLGQWRHGRKGRMVPAMVGFEKRFECGK
jgi:hypothetical protein